MTVVELDVAGVSAHGMRNDLAVIAAAAELLERCDGAGELAEIIRRRTDELDGKLVDLVRFGRLELGLRSPVDRATPDMRLR